MPPGMEENIIGVRVSNAVRSTQYFYEGSSGFVFGIINWSALWDKVSHFSAQTFSDFYS